MPSQVTFNAERNAAQLLRHEQRGPKSGEGVEHLASRLRECFQEMADKHFRVLDRIVLERGRCALEGIREAYELLGGASSYQL